jgi:hypothetical protein
MSMLAILEGTLLAQAAGFAVHYQRGKRAFEPRWSTSPPKIAEEPAGRIAAGRNCCALASLTDVALGSDSRYPVTGLRWRCAARPERRGGTASCEIQKSAAQPTANSAERNLTPHSPDDANRPCASSRRRQSIRQASEASGRLPK